MMGASPREQAGMRFTSLHRSEMRKMDGVTSLTDFESRVGLIAVEAGYDFLGRTLAMLPVADLTRVAVSMGVKPEQEICWFIPCGKPATARCGRCKVAHYCGREHQTAHYRQLDGPHKHYCKRLRDNEPGFRKIYDNHDLDALLTGSDGGLELLWLAERLVAWHLSSFLAVDKHAGACARTYKVDVSDAEVRALAHKYWRSVVYLHTKLSNDELRWAVSLKRPDLGCPADELGAMGAAGHRGGADLIFNTMPTRVRQRACHVRALAAVHAGVVSASDEGLILAHDTYFGPNAKQLPFGDAEKRRRLEMLKKEGRKFREGDKFINYNKRKEQLTAELKALNGGEYIAYFPALQLPKTYPNKAKIIAKLQEMMDHTMEFSKGIGEGVDEILAKHEKGRKDSAGIEVD